MQPSDHFTSYQKKLKRIRALLSRQSALHQRGSVLQTDLESIYEVLFLQAFISFESNVTELFITNLLMKHGASGRRRSLYLPESRASAQRLLIGTGRYFSIMPVEQMEAAAKIYLKDGEPYTLLSPAMKTEIKKAYAVRNHIAHRSTESKAAYKRRVLNFAALPKTSYVPGFYLRSAQTIVTTYFDHHVSELGGALRFLCANT